MADDPVVKLGPRKGHKKSRTGCRTCKTRKIKCDERHPSCLNCICHGVRCAYLGPEQQSERPPQTTTTTTNTPLDSPYYPSPNSSTNGDTTTDHLAQPRPLQTPQLSDNTTTNASNRVSVSSSLPTIELELLHHFTFATYLTFAHSAAVHEFYRTTLVHLGLKCDYLMQALLSVSAQHLAFCHREDSPRRDFYIAQGIELQRRSSRTAVQFMNRLADLDVDELINLFLFSVLTGHFALASHPEHTSSSSPTATLSSGSTPTSAFPEWTFLLNGTKSLAKILGHRAADHPVLTTYRAHGKRWLAARQRLLAEYFPSRKDGASTGVFCKVDADNMTVDNTDTNTDNNNNNSNKKFLPTSLEASSLRQLRRRVLESINLKAVQTTTNPEPACSRRFPTPATGTPSPCTSSIDHQRLLEIYTHALDELDLVFAYTMTHPRPLNPQDTFLFLWEVSDSMIPLLLQPQPQEGESTTPAPSPAPEAVAIFAHYGIILKMYEEEGHVWWVRGWARQIIRRAHDVLDDLHRPWIIWPMREAGLDYDFAGGGLANTMFISLV